MFHGREHRKTINCNEIHFSAALNLKHRLLKIEKELEAEIKSVVEKCRSKNPHNLHIFLLNHASSESLLIALFHLDTKPKAFLNGLNDMYLKR